MSRQMSKLVILHTNDLHSHFEQMPKIAQYVSEMRTRIGEDQLLLLDIGDHMDRMFPQTEGTAGQANIEIMNATHYEAAVLGNNEGLTFTRADLQACYEHNAKFTLIGSNIKEQATGDLPSWMVPYLITVKNGIRVGLIGLTIDFTDFYEELGWKVEDPIKCAAHWARILRPQVDLLVVMSHLGIRHDERLAEEVEGIDVILGGHTHHVIEEPRLIGSSYLCAAGKFGEYVGEVHVSFDQDAKKLVSITGRLQSTVDLEDNKGIRAIIDHASVVAKATLGLEAAKLPEALHMNWYEESVLGNLLASGLRSWADAEIGLVNAGQILRGLEAGSVTKGKLLEICPPPINPCRILLRGSDLLEALEQSLLTEYTHKPIRGYGFRGEFLGMLCIDGAEVTYDSSKPPMERIIDVQIGGKPLIADNMYTVGTIDMFTFGVGYLSLSRGMETRYLLPEFLRDVLRSQLQLSNEITKAAKSRWFDLT
ncbi:bifunctional metallophosphatase/5'-nucleotidase [Paenibacillus sp. N1-5-1-14]|uniref:bifunctional metallophosphatase/5'-nucleotidase n=1 Tax=Paenibacillus radicibacter TaxID=2972488 RepID=UPI00215935C0|nr:bifunctional UDP-sugar hydrolase/5'-nucleotidase [Paenibacillus radicibacter]MCR8643678.1 bifunctional metallophosphatase/5'-nucleotidase [Paenibacillus radicibacter]